MWEVVRIVIGVLCSIVAILLAGGGIWGLFQKENPIWVKLYGEEAAKKHRKDALFLNIIFLVISVTAAFFAVYLFTQQTWAQLVAYALVILTAIAFFVDDRRKKK